MSILKVLSGWECRQFKDLMGSVSCDRDENDLTALVTGQANP
jgi:hypothetical protein